VGEQASETPELPWDSTTLANWRETVEGWPWLPLGRGDWEKSGTCLRCSHGMTVEKKGQWTVQEEIEISEEDLQELLVRANKGPFQATDNDRKGFFARCNCGEKHPGRPSELTHGCGQCAVIELPPDE
jgi:hypothetical protein